MSAVTGSRRAAEISGPVRVDDLTALRDHCRETAGRCAATACAEHDAGDLRRVFDLIRAGTAWKRMADQIDEWLTDDLDDPDAADGLEALRRAVRPGAAGCRPPRPAR